MKSDRLAMDRTLLANERTFMAYVRTALNELAIAFTLIKFFNSTFFAFVGYLLLPVVVATLIVGYRRYTRVKQSIRGQINELRLAC